MATALETTQPTDTAAMQAADNFRANLSALISFQPDLPARLKDGDTNQSWIFARDGYLTARSGAGWLTGCSVPLRTARQLLQKLDLIGTLGCFLNPNHAAQIRAALEKIQPVQALVAIIPNSANLRLLFHCDDFSAEIAAARLFFVAGPDWPDQLGALFEKYPGLPLPQQFLRTSLLDDSEMSDLSTEAQRIISTETSRRSKKMAEIISQHERPTRTGRIVVLAGSRFNLGDLSNVALRQALPEDDRSFITFDPDHPLTAGPLALAEAAADADALVAADLFRADLPNVISRRTAWLTWITTGRITAPDAQCSRDGLLLADPTWRQGALNAGWPAARIQIAGWPQIVPPAPVGNSPPVLGILTDTRTIEIPQKVRDFSSQHLLWEYVEDELTRDPLALGDDPDRYLNSRMARFNIRDEKFERGIFFDHLIAPAYKRGLTLFLMKNGIRLALFGRGWNEMTEFKSCAMGPIENLADMTRAVSQCHAILQPYSDRTITTAGLPLPMIRTIGLHPARLLGRIRETLGGKPSVKSNPTPLNGNAITSLLSEIRNSKFE
jgi:hypothetical protein